MLDAPRAVVAGDPAVGQVPVRRAPEDPRRPAELGFRRPDRLPLRHRARVPGSTTRCDRSPTSDPRPGSRSAARSTPPRRDRRRAVRARANRRPTGPPRTAHSRPTASRGDPRRGRQSREPSGEIRGLDVEAPAARDHARLRAPVRGERDQLVVDVVGYVRPLVPLPHPDPERSVRGDATVRVSVRARRLRRDRDRVGTRFHPVQPLVLEPRAEQRAAMDGEGAAAVLVHRRPDVEVGRDTLDRIERTDRRSARRCGHPRQGRPSDQYATPSSNQVCPIRRSFAASIAALIGEDHAP